MRDKIHWSSSHGKDPFRQSVVFRWINTYILPCTKTKLFRYNGIVPRGNIFILLWFLDHQQCLQSAFRIWQAINFDSSRFYMWCGNLAVFKTNASNVLQDYVSIAQPAIHNTEDTADGSSYFTNDISTDWQVQHVRMPTHYFSVFQCATR